MSHKYKVGDTVMHARHGKVKIIALDVCMNDGTPTYRAEKLEAGESKLEIGAKVTVVEGEGYLEYLIEAAPTHKFKIGAKVSTTYGDGTVEAYGGGPYYKVRIPKPKNNWFSGIYESTLFAINERDMTEIVEKYMPQAGDFVTWGSGVSGFAFIGVAGDKAYLATPGADLMTGKPVLEDRVAHTTDAGYFLETVRKVEKPKAKRTIEVEIDLVKEGGKFIAAAASDEDPNGGFGKPMPNRVATRRITFEVEA